MVRKYRTKGTGVTASREEARANRKLQLIVNNSHPGERGKTLLEKMEEKLDQTLIERANLTRSYDVATDDETKDDLIDSLLNNEGRIQGMLLMLAIMRSTTNKTELQRARARIKHAQAE